MSRVYALLPLLCIVFVLGSSLPFSQSVHASGPHWIRIDSSHFSVLTDVDEKRGRDVAVRFEQMRGVFAQLMMKTRVNMPEPIEIIALNEDEYTQRAPARQGEGLGTAFFLAGDDRDYFVLNLSREESWRAISAEFARVLLNYNYPPTQSWFDQGFAEYFSSLQLTDKQMQIGGDPKAVFSQQNAGKPVQSATSGKLFADVLSGSNWLTIPDLFGKPQTEFRGSNGTLFDAESWIVMHYLLSNGKLPETGAYFGLVQNDKLPVEEAIQKAYGITPVQLEQAVKEHLQSIAKQPGTGSSSNVSSWATAPVTADVIGSSTHATSELEGRALVAEMSLRLPEHREAARKELGSITSDPKTDNVFAHRALGWAYLENKQFEQSIEELAKAVELDPRDPWTHYYLALVKYRQAESGSKGTKGLANMMQDLHMVLDWDREFAEAYYMLAVAQNEGGGVHAAVDSMQAAIRLNPRNQSYLLMMAKIYEAGRNWDAATSLLERLSTSSDSQVASAARKDLQELPYIKKYGIPPTPDTGSKADTNPKSSSTSASPAVTPQPGASRSSPSARRAAPQKAAPQQTTQEPQEGNEQSSEQAPSTPQIDKRPIHYLKAKLLSVDCSKAPMAIVTVAAGAKTMKLRTSDYKSLMLIGEDTFSCDWTNRAVSVNYKAASNADGDLVSLEVH